jgi:hypothetical protein
MHTRHAGADLPGNRPAGFEAAPAFVAVAALRFEPAQ